MALVLQEFVESSQQIIDIRSYTLDAEYGTSSRNIVNTEAYGRMLTLDSRVQYLDSHVAPFLSAKKGLKFTKSMRK